MQSAAQALLTQSEDSKQGWAMARAILNGTRTSVQVNDELFVSRREISMKFDRH